MTVDTKEVIEKMSVAVLDGDKDTIATFSTPDCMIDVGGKSVPFVEYWMDLPQKVGKIKWINEYFHVGANKVIFRCWDYAENKEGTDSIMFYVDCVVTFNDEGKISHYEAHMTDEHAANLGRILGA